MLNYHFFGKPLRKMSVISKRVHSEGSICLYLAKKVPTFQRLWAKQVALHNGALYSPLHNPFKNSNIISYKITIFWPTIH